MRLKLEELIEEQNNILRAGLAGNLTSDSLNALCIAMIDGTAEGYKRAMKAWFAAKGAQTKVDAGEDLTEAALRELREETGAVPRELIDMGDYFGSPAIMGERIRMFLARGLTFGNDDPDEDEFIEVFRVPLSEAVQMVLRGEIPDGKTQCGILRAYAMLGTEKSK